MSRQAINTDALYCCDFCDRESTLENMTHVHEVKQYTSKTTVKGWKYEYSADLNICTPCFKINKTPCRFETGIIFIDSEDEREFSYTIEDDMNHSPTYTDDSKEFNLSRDKYGEE